MVLKKVLFDLIWKKQFFGIVQDCFTKCCRISLVANGGNNFEDLSEINKNYFLFQHYQIFYILQVAIIIFIEYSFV